ncbi:MAG: aminotransferase class IV [Desulfobacteraceae bacterium]|jgi:branched-chain amino acid aminotransferase|nr:aminotransferase class IV [Desulfobacteraceae bacterium]
MNIYYIDGEFVQAQAACLPVDDLSILRGFGVFDFLRTYGGRPFHLKDHLARLKRSAELIGLGVGRPLGEIADIVGETLRRNGHAEANIRIVVTGGSSPDCFLPAGRPRLLVLVTPLTPLPETWQQDGVGIVTIPYSRYLPNAKSINYIPAIHAMQDARRQGAVEALYVKPDGRVTEFTTSNLFAVIDGRLLTPETDLLPGITRQVVLDLDLPLPAQIGDLTLEALHGAEEVFLTSSTKEVVPVVRIDRRPVADGRPGKRTRETMARFRDYTERYGRG